MAGENFGNQIVKVADAAGPEEAVTSRALQSANSPSSESCQLTNETIMSRTIKFTKAGGPEVLEFIEMEVPAPGPNEVRINVKAIGINRADSMWRNDKYTEAPIFPQ